MTTAAVVGCGDIFTTHLEALATLPEVTLVGVCDPDRERAEAAAAATGAAVFTDHHALIAALTPDVVHVTTPHHTHAAIALDVLTAGSAVLLEKPLASTLADGERLVAAAAAASAKVGVCFQNRYNAPVQAMRALLDGGRLGEVRGGAATVQWHRTPAYYASRPWRSTWAGSGGGLMMNQAIHTLDLLQWLVGRVVGVGGHVATRTLAAAIEVEDTAEIALDHADGAHSTFFGTLGHPSNAPVTLDVVTEAATLSLRGDLVVSWADGRTETVAEPLAATGKRSYWGVSHQRLIADFYATLDDPEPFWIGPAQAYESLRIIKEVYRQTFPERPERFG